MTSPVALLRERRFTPLFLVQFLGAFNDQVFKTGFVSLLTYRLADEMGLNAGFHNTLAAALFIIPFALFAPTAGQIADGMDKARMMRWVKGAEIGLMTLGAIAFQVQNLGLLYALLFLMGAQSAVFSPIKYGVLPQYLRPHELIAGNGLIQGATFLAILMGQIVGLNLILSHNGALVIAAAVICVSILGFVASLYAPPAPPPGAGPKPDFLFPRAVWNVVRESRQSRAAFRAILGVGWFWFVGALFMALLLPFAKEGLHADQGVSTLLLATFSLGVAAGSVLCARLYSGGPRMGAAPWGAVGIAVFSIGLYLSAEGYRAAAPAPEGLIGVSAFLARDWSWSALACFAGLAACAGVYLTPLNALMQAEAPPEARGRIVACSNVIDSALMASSSLVGMALIAAGLSAHAIMALIGASGFFAALWAARYAPETRLGRAAGRIWPPAA